MKKIYITFALFKNLDTPSPFMLLSITIFGFVVTFLLLINLRRTNKVNIYLFFFLLINNIYALSHYATIYSGNKYLIAIMLVHFTPFYCNIGATYGGGSGNSAYNNYVTTTPSGSWFGWGFGNAGDYSTYLVNDTTNNRVYRITMSIGAGYVNNFITIERLN